MVVKTTDVNPRAEKTAVRMPPKTIDRQQMHAEKLAQAGEKSILVAKELKFVKSLAGNDPKLRRKVLKNLKIWLSTRSRSTFAFTDSDFMRLWKGLFYCMWMSDKPLTQENLADEIASLVLCFENLAIATQYFGAFLETMCIEWFGIDNWRIDKFMMLVRRCTRQMLVVIQEAGWPRQHVETLMKHVEKTILNVEKCPFGLTKHFDDLLLEELAKVSEGRVDPEVIHTIVQTYVIRLLSTNDMRLIKHITSSIFHSLLYQSELGQDYQEKFNVWKTNNFATGKIDAVECETVEEEADHDSGSDSEGEGTSREKTYDPRAGQVDVVINEMKFDPLQIVELFESHRFKPFVTAKGKKHMKMIVKQYKKFATGVFPLGVQTVDSISRGDYFVDIDDQVEELENYQKELVGEKPSKKKRNTDKMSNQSSQQKSPKIENGKKKKVTKADAKQQKLILLKQKREAKLKQLKEKKTSKSSKKIYSTPDQAQEKPCSPLSSPTENVSSATECESKKKESNRTVFAVKDEWSEPLKDGEVEMFLPSRKTKLKEISKQLAQPETEMIESAMVKNPFATPKSYQKSLKRTMPHTDEVTASKKKRVKIALNKNISQDIQQHIQQVKSSPQLPYDSSKKPRKAALKPNLMPSPINPFYRKKMGLKFNDTL